MNVTVRPERGGDEAAVRAVNDAAFGRPLEGAIVDGVRGTDRWIIGGSLVAELDDTTVAGHLLLSKGELVHDDASGRQIWVIGPVAVLPERQRQGVGTSLMRAAITFAIDHRQPVVCLLGLADYYPRFGFVPARTIGLEPPQPWPDENWLALRLPTWERSWTGTVHYPPAFSE